jgi:hypothetical protein
MKQFLCLMKGLSMNDTTIFSGLSLPQQALVFDVEALYACLQSIPAHRDRRGLQYPKVRYGVTSLPADLADPKRVLELTRGHWGIENGPHYRRDATMREDHAQGRIGHVPEMLAVRNNTVLGLFARQGAINVAEARREFAYRFDRALTSLVA